MRRERLGGQNMIQLRATSLHRDLLRTKMILELVRATPLGPATVTFTERRRRRFGLCLWYHGPSEFLHNGCKVASGSSALTPRAVA